MRLFPILSLLVGLSIFACESEPAPKSAVDSQPTTPSSPATVPTPASALPASIDAGGAGNAGGAADSATPDASPTRGVGVRPVATLLEPDATDRCDKDADCILFDAQMCCHPSSGCTWRPGTTKGERAFRDYADHNFCPRARVICGEPNQCAKPHVAVSCKAHVCRATLSPSEPVKNAPTLVEPTPAVPKSVCTRDSDCAFYSNQMCCEAERSCAFASRSRASQAEYAKNEHDFCPTAKVRCAELGACSLEGYGHNFEPACIDGACSTHRLPPPHPNVQPSPRPSH